MKPETVLTATLFGLIIFAMFFIKILGATDIPIDVEKNGFCKQFGDDWENKFGSNVCFHKEQTKITFTEEEFRKHCPKNKLISLKFNSDCFYESGSIV